MCLLYLLGIYWLDAVMDTPRVSNPQFFMTVYESYCNKCTTLHYAYSTS